MKISTIQILYLGSLFSLKLNGVEGDSVSQNMQKFNNSPRGMRHNTNGGMGSRFDAMDGPVGSLPRLDQQDTQEDANPHLSSVFDYGGPIEDDYGGEISPNESTWGLGKFLYSTGAILFVLLGPIIDAITYWT